MSKKSLFKNLIPGLIAVSFASWGGVALADDGLSGDILGDGICGGNPGKLIAGFNLPDMTGDGTIVKLPDGQMPAAIEMSGDTPPFSWELMDIGHDEIVIHSIELFGVVGDGDPSVIVDQEFSEPYPENGDLPKTGGLTAVYQVYFCGDYLLVEMSDAVVELGSGNVNFSVDPVSEMKEGATGYVASCTATSDQISADGRTNYEAKLRYDDVECYIKEIGPNGHTAVHAHEASVK